MWRLGKRQFRAAMDRTPGKEYPGQAQGHRARITQEQQREPEAARAGAVLVVVRARVNAANFAGPVRRGYRFAAASRSGRSRTAGGRPETRKQPLAPPDPASRQFVGAWPHAFKNLERPRFYLRLLGSVRIVRAECRIQVGNGRTQVQARVVDARVERHFVQINFVRRRGFLAPLALRSGPTPGCSRLVRVWSREWFLYDLRPHDLHLRFCTAEAPGSEFGGWPCINHIMND